MGEFSFLQVCVAINIIGLAAISQASFGESACDSGCIEGFLAAHNKAREAVGSPPLKWNTTLAEYAESYATKRAADCLLEHSGGPYGENIAMAGSELSAEASVKLWMDEKPYYNHNTNACVSQECLHYTQVVWGNTTTIGCARATCKTGWMFVTCNYYPPGNYAGQKPY
ncbi:PREDICTED: basic form of pathogenesis-related protein 1-like [Ipomoea nil]|uniref:basic form of pathogenesis-related protein 1-like n=1 Tax=Ipomoea nil TaxID=35883 RepID=UPI000901FF47|nr:PREDICTED: basic form of pathogenesis-related protein 1-like [Ipomoea nil]XP_019172972.1 PREDICTED: basic form of pathogenesis-related protein 1-like [Ipomoea nil]